MSNSYKTSNRYIFLTKSSIIKFSKEKFTTKLTLNSWKPPQNESILPILRKNRDFGNFLSNKPRNRENTPRTEISLQKPSNGNTGCHCQYWSDKRLNPDIPGSNKNFQPKSLIITLNKRYGKTAGSIYF